MQPPTSNSIQINFDGAYLSSNNFGSIGVVARGDDGAILVVKAIFLSNAINAEMMEALSLSEATRVAISFPHMSDILEGDAQS